MVTYQWINILTMSDTCPPNPTEYSIVIPSDLADRMFMSMDNSFSSV